MFVINWNCTSHLKDIDERNGLLDCDVLEEVGICIVIFRGDSLSPLMMVICLISVRAKLSYF